MENFVVSARKYRPVTFDTVVGQDHITSTLRHAILSKHLAQAFLFCGPRGVGKTTCARILARTINCQQITSEGNACGTCASCSSFQSQGSFNIIELDAASNNSVDDIRNLTDQVRIPPQFGNFKVYIIDEVHMLTTAAFNAFLKTLEEPPPYAIFILATTEKHKIIPTILSRCQIFDFNRIRNQDIADQLARVASLEEIQFEQEALLQIARKADGGLRDALSMFDMISTFSADRKVSLMATLENLHILDSDYYFRVMDYVFEGNSSALLLLFDEILRKGFEGQHFLTGLAEHIRNILMASDPNTHVLLEQGGETVTKLKQQCSQEGFSFFLSLLNLVNKTELQYRNSKNPRLLVELVLMKMALFRNQAKQTDAGSSTFAAFRGAEASIREYKETLVPSAKLNFKKTPKLSDQNSTQTGTTLQANSNHDEENKKLPPLDLNTAKESYLQWYAQKNFGPVSSWSMAVSENLIENGFRLSFLKNSLAEEGFREEEKRIREFFSNNYSSVPVFELISVSQEESGYLKPYTNQEKFRFLAEKSVALTDLKRKLNLDFS